VTEPVSEPAALRRARLLVAYDGAGFHGFAENPGVATVAGTLATTIARVVRRPVELTGAGRTDTGVHAVGQVVSCDLPVDTDLEGLVRRVNKMCAPRLVVRSAQWVAHDFDARHSAQWRRYRYTVLNRAVPDPFLAATSWHVPQPLAIRAMQLGCDPLIGEHDFSSFCRRPKVEPGTAPPSLVRRVLSASWHRAPAELGEDVWWFEIRATAFCHQMVRSIVGTLVDVGLGRLHAGEIRGILLARDRSAAGQVAPPHGLCLLDVAY
jgi:tRNA pseudouridine38-40 synthase